MQILSLKFIVFIMMFSASSFAEARGKVLFVVSNVVDMGDIDKHDARNNLWEVAPPYHIFLSHGYDVDFVSPKGGHV